MASQLHPPVPPRSNFPPPMLTRLKQLSQAIKWQQKKNYTMAWYCSGSTNTELVDNLFKVGLIQNEQVKEAMLGVSNPCSP